MNILDINLNDYLLCAVEAFTEVYGKQYEDFISKKLLEKTLIIKYQNPKTLKAYINYKRKGEFKKFFVKFLKRIGQDVSEYEKDNYMSLDISLEKVIDHYMFFSWKDSLDNYDYIDKNSILRNLESYSLKTEKARFINYILGEDKVNVDNIDSFIGTEDYEKMLNLLSKYNDIYDEVFIDYLNWDDSLKPCDEYIKKEEKHFTDISHKKQLELLEEIKGDLPPLVKELICDMDNTEIVKALFGDSDIFYGNRLEEFTTKKMEILKDKTKTNWRQKRRTIAEQLLYFEDIGLNINDYNFSKFFIKDENDLKKVDEYIDYLNSKSVRLVMPSPELADRVKDLREKKMKEASIEYYKTREDFINAFSHFSNTTANFEFLYNNIKKNVVCVYFGTSDKDDFYSIMFYEFRDFGYSFYNFLHECGHAIDQNSFGAGFESIEGLHNPNEINPYDKTKRWYERFSEVVNDIFTLEAIKYFEDNGVYLIEDYEYTMLNRDNYNSFFLVKKILEPLIENYRSEVIDAKVNTKIEYLTDRIGIENFESLVEIVNKVDYLCTLGLDSKLKQNVVDSVVTDYQESLELIKRIYEKIDKFSNREKSKILKK